MIVTSWLAVVLIGTLPKLTLDGLAAATLIAGARCTVNVIGRQVPPAIGHSNTVVCRSKEPTLVGVKRSVTLQVPGPAKPPPAPQVSKSKPNGALIPEPEAISVR